MRRTDPKTINLNSRVVIEERNNYLNLIINRKSRIIMKDGKRILEQVNQIKKVSKKRVLISTSAPVCSKTKNFLSENSIEIIQKNKRETSVKRAKRKRP